MSPVAVIGGLVETDAVGTGGDTYTAGYFIVIELQVTDEVTGVIIKVGKVLGSRLL